MIVSHGKKRSTQPEGLSYMECLRKIQGPALDQALDGEGLFVRKKAKMREMIEIHFSVLENIIDLCPHPRKTTLQARTFKLSSKHFNKQI